MTHKLPPSDERKSINAGACASTRRHRHSSLRALLFGVASLSGSGRRPADSRRRACAAPRLAANRRPAACFQRRRAHLKVRTRALLAPVDVANQPEQNLATAKVGVTRSTAVVAAFASVNAAVSARARRSRAYEALQNPDFEFAFIAIQLQIGTVSAERTNRFSNRCEREMFYKSKNATFSNGFRRASALKIGNRPPTASNQQKAARLLTTTKNQKPPAHFDNSHLFATLANDCKLPIGAKTRRPS